MSVVLRGRASLKDRRSVLRVLVLGAVLLLVGLPLGPWSDNASALTVRPPIYIAGNGGFSAANGVTGGSGTPTDPYVIRGWSIDASSTTGIRIQDTDAHIIVEDSYISGTGTRSGVWLLRVRNAVIENLTVERMLRGIEVDDSVRVTLADNVVTDSALYGVDVGATRDLQVTGNTVARTGEDGIRIFRSPEAIIERNSASESALLDQAAGIHLDESADARIERNLVWSNFNGIQVFDSSGLLLTANEAWGQESMGLFLDNTSNAQVVRNRGYSNGADGIWITFGNGVVLEDNEFSDNAAWGIAFTTTTPGPVYQHVSPVVARNRIENNTWGLRLYETLGGRVVDNDFVNNTVLGVHVRGMDITVLDNRVTGTSRSIELLNPSSGILVEANVVTGGNWGVIADWTADLLIERNVIVGNARGVSLDSTYNATVSNNDLSDNSQWGVRVYSATQTVVANNSFANSTNAIYATSSRDGSIYDNRVATSALGIALVFGTLGFRVYHNDLLSNAIQARDELGSENQWDDGYPSGGNWWSDYAGPDVCSGPLQDVCPDPDAIGDAPRVIDGNSQDRYPFTTPSNIPPRAAFNVTPAVGNVTTSFQANASRSWDLEDPANVLEVRWDWEDDGAWDTAWSTTKTAAHAYGPIGTYSVRVAVRDTGGLVDETVRQVDVLNEPPRASFLASPAEGGLATPFRFDGSASLDLEDPTASLEVRWDWEDDAVWDTGWSSALMATHVFGVPGGYDVRMEVRDSQGATDDDVHHVDVLPGPVTTVVVGAPTHLGAFRYVTSATPIELLVLDQSGRGINRTQYRIDGGAWTDYVAPFELTGDGIHFLEWFSEDNVGNVEAVDSITLVVDDTPPSVSLTLGLPSYGAGTPWVTPTTPITLGAVDGGSEPAGLDRIEFRTWNGTWSAWSDYLTPFAVAEEGLHFIEVRALDLLGNLGPAANTSFVVDGTPPASALGVGDPRHIAASRWVTSSTPLSLSAADGGVLPVGTERIEYRTWNGSWSPWMTYGAPFLLSGEGEHLVEHRALDLLGNIGGITAESIVVDNSPPDTELLVGSPSFAGTYVTPDTLLMFSSADRGLIPAGVASTEFRLGVGAWVLFTVPFSLGGEGSVALQFRSTDLLGNVEPPQSVALWVDTTPPTTALETDSEPWTPTALFHLNASDAGSGVERTEYRVDGGPWQVFGSAFNLSLGSHVLGYRSMDRLGNVEEETQTTVAIVDGQAADLGLRVPDVNLWFILFLFLAVTGLVLILVFLWRRRRENEKTPPPHLATANTAAPLPSGSPPEPGADNLK